jgi:putative salt-induced outer membrane protein
MLGSSAAWAHGEGPGAAPEDGWSGNIAGGYVATSGNSDNSTASLKGELFYDQGRWHHSALATALGASADNESTAEAYKAQAKSKFDLNETLYLFGLVEWNKDKFSAYDRQMFEVAGLGWRVFRGNNQELNLEAGVGATQSRLAQLDPCLPFDPPDPDEGQSLPAPDCLTGSQRDAGEFIGRLGGDYHWHISETALFSQKIATSIGSDNTYVESLTELKATVIGNLALVLGYLVKHNTDVPDSSLDKTDTQTSVTLEYKF